MDAVVPSLGVPSRAWAGGRSGPPWAAQHTGDAAGSPEVSVGGDGERAPRGLPPGLEGGVGSEEAPLAQARVRAAPWLWQPGKERARWCSGSMVQGRGRAGLRPRPGGGAPRSLVKGVRRPQVAVRRVLGAVGGTGSSPASPREREGPEQAEAEGVRGRWVPTSQGGDAAYLPCWARHGNPLHPIPEVSVGLGDP